MSKSAKGAAAAKLVQDAISAQGVYFFAELLDAPNIKDVRRTNRPSLTHVLIRLMRHLLSAREQRTAPSVLCVTPDIHVQNISRLPPYDRPISFSRVVSSLMTV